MKYTILEYGIKNIGGLTEEEVLTIACPECKHKNYEKNITGTNLSGDREIRLVCSCGCVFKVEAEK